MTEEDIAVLNGTRFLGRDGKVIMFLQPDPIALIVPEGVNLDEAAKEFVRIVNEMLLPTNPKPQDGSVYWSCSVVGCLRDHGHAGEHVFRHSEKWRDVPVTTGMLIDGLRAMHDDNPLAVLLERVAKEIAAQ